MDTTRRTALKQGDTCKQTFYRHLYNGGTPTPPNTNICKIWRLCGAKSSLVFNKSFSNLATLWIWRRSFHPCWRIFAATSGSTVEKTVAGSINWTKMYVVWLQHENRTIISSIMFYFSVRKICCTHETFKRCIKL